MARKPSYGRDQEYVPKFPPKPKADTALPKGGTIDGSKIPKRPAAGVATAKPGPVGDEVKPLLERDLAGEGRRLQAYVEGRVDGSIRRKPGKASKVFTPAVTFMAAAVVVLVLMVGGALMLAATVQQPAPRTEGDLSAVPTAPVPPAGTPTAPTADVVQVEDDTRTRSGDAASGGGSMSPEQASKSRENSNPPATDGMPPQ